MASRKPHREAVTKTKNEEFYLRYTWKTPDIEAGATIQACVVTSAPAGLTLDGIPVIDAPNNRTSQKIKAGKVGGKYEVKFQISTDAGEKWEAFWDVSII